MIRRAEDYTYCPTCGRKRVLFFQRARGEDGWSCTHLDCTWNTFSGGDSRIDARERHRYRQAQYVQGKVARIDCRAIGADRLPACSERRSHKQVCPSCARPIRTQTRVGLHYVRDYARGPRKRVVCKGTDSLPVCTSDCPLCADQARRQRERSSARAIGE